MQSKSRKQRVAEYGSFLFCPVKDTICSALDNDDGICREAPCYLERPGYREKQEQIARNVAENARREWEEREKERLEPPAPIRRQTKTKEQLLEEEIARKEKYAEHLYSRNRPKAANAVMSDAMILRRQLKKTKGA